MGTGNTPSFEVDIMRVLMLVIRMDEDDWATAFIPRWVEALSQQVERVDVLALEVGRGGFTS